MNLWRVTKSRTIFSYPNHNRLPRLLPAGRSSLKGIATWVNKHQPSGPDEPADHPTHNVSPGPTEWRRPSEIPYQTKVANSVQLVGSIERPVEMVSSEDGTCSASTVLTHRKMDELPHFRSVSTPLSLKVLAFLICVCRGFFFLCVQDSDNLPRRAG
ncbi:hypothetical protein QJS04_geneDACA004037 [Acorus gramineus]|uniref:Uncharacterized protein n=1 Tax=Acorus gramineus TaxID=55184 RepID=A0AAV9BLB2_ACOGR|nr:hypothetical protein QJS04_geneDACA004037 [Acorus gramineus]